MPKFKYSTDIDKQCIEKIMSIKCPETYAVYVFSIIYETSTEKKVTYEIIKSHFNFTDKKLQKIFTTLFQMKVMLCYSVTSAEGLELDSGIHVEGGLTPCEECKLYTSTPGCWCDPETPLCFQLNIDENAQ